MALELKKPSQLPAALSVASGSSIPVDNGIEVQKATPQQIVDAGRPVASEAQAIAGIDNETAMTPLTTKQAVEAAGVGAVALAQAWAESPTSPDGGPNSKSSKTWAGEAAASAERAEATVGAERATMAANIAFGFVPTNAVTYHLDGRHYLGQTGATVIADLAGLVPVAPVTPQHFGAVGNGVTNDTSAVQQAVTAGGTVVGVGIYAISSKINIPAGVTLSASLKWIGAADGTMIELTGQGVTLDGCTIDGGSLARNGVYDPSGINKVVGCRIINLYSTTNQTVGIQGMSAAGGSIYDGNYFNNIESVGDASFGNSNGASRAILLQWSANFGAGYTVSNNEIRGIIGEEGDAIQVLAITGTTFYSASGTRIFGNKIVNPSKRGIKIQAHDVLCYDNVVKLNQSYTTLYGCITVQSASRVEVFNNYCETLIEGVRGIVASVDAGAVAPKGCRIASNTIFTAVDVAGLAIYSLGHDSIQINDNKCHYGRVIIELASRGVAKANTFYSTALSSTDGCVSFRNNCTAGAAIGNLQVSGVNYTVVRSDSQRTTIKDNVTLSVNYLNLSAVLVSTPNNIIMNNVNALNAVATVNYIGTTAGAQIAVVNNYNLGL